MYIFLGDVSAATSAALNISGQVVDVKADRSGNIYFPGPLPITAPLTSPPKITLKSTF